MSECATQTKCSECGEPIVADHAYPGEDNTDLCELCYKDGTYPCGVCDEREYSTFDWNLFLVLQADEAGLPIGLYRIIKRPFYRWSTTGPEEIFPDAVERIGDLPDDATGGDGFACTLLCRDCEAKCAAEAATQPGGGETT